MDDVTDCGQGWDYSQLEAFVIWVDERPSRANEESESTHVCDIAESVTSDHNVMHIIALWRKERFRCSSPK